MPCFLLCTRQHYSNQNLPEQLVRFNNVKKLNERIAETKQNVVDCEQNHAKLRTAVKEKSETI